MQWLDRMRQIRIILVICAIVIAIVSLVASHILVHDLKTEENNKMEVWASAMRSLNTADENTDLTLVLQVLNGNNTIPVIVCDNKGEVQEYRNIEIQANNSDDSLKVVKRMAQQLIREKKVIKIYFDTPSSAVRSNNHFIEICYDDSLLLRRLSLYPYVQLLVVLIFVLVAIFALLSSKRAEQNKVWVGLSKETAHQLGTPISSLLAWTEILKETYPDDDLVPEMEHDVHRLERIAERFSKIGSLPELHEADVNEVIRHVAEYMRKRASSRISVEVHCAAAPLVTQLCPSLFEWVVENLCKNAIDAMEHGGKLVLSSFEEGNKVVVEVADTGKGINKKHFNTVFTPGFTTKKRGWGLGLSLAKRIVEEYHKGYIYVKSSEPGKGTIFRIELKK